jgi:hypothetical protein
VVGCAVVKGFFLIIDIELCIGRKGNTAIFTFTVWLWWKQGANSVTELSMNLEGIRPTTRTTVDRVIQFSPNRSHRKRIVIIANKTTKGVPLWVS